MSDTQQPWPPADAWALVYLPSRRFPPRRERLGDVARRLRRREIDSDAMVQMSPDQPWVSALQVVGAMHAFQPTRAWPFALAVVAVPVLLSVLHALVFGVAGVLPLVVLLILAALAAHQILTRDSLRIRLVGELARALSNSGALLGGIVALVGVAESLALLQGLPALRRERALESSDPCAVESLGRETFAEAGRSWEFDAQLERCAARRRNEAELATAKRCEQVVSGLRVAKLETADEQWLGPSGPLAKRIATDALATNDLYTDPAKLPCPAQSVAVFAAAAARSAKAWGEVDEVAYYLKPAVLAQGGLSAEARQVLGQSAERSAKDALVRGKKSQDLDGTIKRCTLAEDFGAAAPTCKDAAALYARLLAGEEAVRKAEEKRQEAARAMCEAARDRRAQCLEKCMDRADQLEAAGRELPDTFDCGAICTSRGYPEPTCTD